VDAAAIAFQDDVANTLDRNDYRLLFGLDRDERVRLADPSIAKKVYGIAIPDQW
jgi:hypothetical protein